MSQRTVRERAWVGAAVASWMNATSVARACPDCDIGRIARQQFFRDDFAMHLVVALAPFVLIALVSLCAEWFAQNHARRPVEGARS